MLRFGNRRGIQHIMQNVINVQTKQYSTQDQIRNTVIFGISNILMLYVIFPYVSPVNLGSDTQPFALLFSIFIIFVLSVMTKRILLTKELFVLMLMFLYTCFMFMLSPEKTNAIRSLAGYATLFFVTYASYNTSKNIKTKWFNLAVYIWFSVAVVQLTVDKYFGDFLLPRMSTSESRGVTSLAVEPSYFAIVCVFLLLLNDLLKSLGKQKKLKHITIMSLLIFQIIITFSGMGFIFLLIYMGGKFISILAKEGIWKHKGKLVMICIAIVATFLSFRTIDSLQQSRAGAILAAAIIDPKVVLIEDASIADRLSHAILPLYSIVYSSGIGLGMGTWTNYLPQLQSYAGGYVEVIAQYASPGRIMSGWGTAIYELGILGLVYLIVYLRIMVGGSKRRKDISSEFVSAGITILLLMFMAVPLAFPLFSYMLGMYMYYGKKEI